MNKLKAKKKYFVKKRITARALQQEKDLIIKYGLRNKSELAKFTAKLQGYRKTYFANLLNTKFISVLEQILVNKGILDLHANKSILQLNVEDLLKCRLQYRVFTEKICNSLMSARQKITHGHIYVDNVKIKRPNLIVNKDAKILFKVKGGEVYGK